jgi:argininosuccinate lyase
LSSPSRSGAFDQSVDHRVERFTESISFDHRLYQQDILGSQAHARMLAKQNLITKNEADQIVNALEQIREEINAGIFQHRYELEDIHMHIEQQLIDRLGDVGRKLHTARSRNDQVTTDTRLWIRDAIVQIDDLLQGLQRAFLNRCEGDKDVVLPAYTHMQRAQPVLAPHYWLAYIEKFQRDRDRLADCLKRVNVSSLGMAAVAGTSLDIDREMTARELGFESLAENSIDVSSDRDYVLETVFCLTTIALHLSTWAEEWIIWSTTEFGFISLPHQFCTGSSIMPQKVNPDVLELTRGKTARVIGSLQTLLVLMKGLPLAYNRDLQEDKQPLFDAVDTVVQCLQLAEPIVSGSTLNRQNIAKRIDEGFLDATTLMETLIKSGTPQRTAHHLVGQLVRLASRSSMTLAEIPADLLKSESIEIDPSVLKAMGIQNCVGEFVSRGSTGIKSVDAQILRWKDRLRG